MGARFGYTELPERHLLASPASAALSSSRLLSSRWFLMKFARWELISETQAAGFGWLPLFSLHCLPGAGVWRGIVTIARIWADLVRSSTEDS